MPLTSTPQTSNVQLFLHFLFLPIENFVIFGLFLLTFSNLMFFIPAGWPNFFPASLKGGQQALPKAHFRTDKASPLSLLFSADSLELLQ